ncbi:hypothetical protein O9G_003908 [Rozella allomycis CSF55]|uniref:Gag1-like clamp domain-containing protein n=1 Tax=Rozella allomycis (strain CSF55) TaxID=988480 RepID=A0A075ATA8_ROZAC|nr:hypothetical protein O9G_003908 [Rozella allomycis CSF55]|eukprot:EPZ33405.1 hypothetical protein O9G_003908 [Rozella allomycis CSF55]
MSDYDSDNEEPILDTDDTGFEFAKSAYPALYQKLIVEKRPLKKPMKLLWAMRVIWYNWQREDWFPKKEELHNETLNKKPKEAK